MAAQAKNRQEIEKARKLNHVPWDEEYEKMISGMLYVYDRNFLYQFRITLL
jgi:hypothetical protein